MRIKVLIAFLVVTLTALGSGWALTSSSLGEARSELEVQREEVIRLEGICEDYYKTLQERDLEFQELQRDFATNQEEIETLKQEVTSLQDSINVYKDTFGEVYSEIQVLPYGTYDTQFSLEMRNFNLVNNEEAINPTWKELRDFLREDPTDQHDYLEKSGEYKVKGGYLIGIYMCGNFAETLHNNAEETGIRAAWVALHFEKGEPHALNAFKTTDRGLVFIDSTGLEPSERGPKILDKIWVTEIGKKPIVKSVFPQSGWETRWKVSTDIVINIEIYW